MKYNYVEASGEARIQKENLIKLYCHGLLIENVDVSIDISEVKLGDDIIVIEFEVNSTDRGAVEDFLGLLHHFGDIRKLNSAMQESNQSHEERYLYEDDSLFHLSPTVQSYYEERYEVFKKEVLNLVSADINCEKFLDVELATLQKWVTNSESSVELGRALSIHNKQGLFDLEGASINVFNEKKAKHIDEVVNLSLFVSSGELTFTADVDRQLFDQKVLLENIIPNSVFNYFSSEKIRVSVSPFGFEKFYESELPVELAKNLLRDEPCNISVLLNGDSFYPCNLCERKFEKIFAECEKCSFSPIDPTNALTQWLMK